MAAFRPDRDDLVCAHLIVVCETIRTGLRKNAYNQVVTRASSTTAAVA